MEISHEAANEHGTEVALSNTITFVSLLNVRAALNPQTPAPTTITFSTFFDMFDNVISFPPEESTTIQQVLESTEISETGDLMI